jgi:hypothetical protein
MHTRSLSRAALAFALAAGCAAPEPVAAPPPDLRPVKVKFSRLVNPELNRPYREARVRTVAAFAALFPLMGDEHAKGWLGAIMYAAKHDDGRLACDTTRTSTAGGAGLVVVARTAVGDGWADADNGAVYELTGVLHGGGDIKAYPWGWYGPGRKVAEKPVFLEVEELEPLGRCDVLNGYPWPAAPAAAAPPR